MSNGELRISINEFTNLRPSDAAILRKGGYTKEDIIELKKNPQQLRLILENKTPKKGGIDVNLRDQKSFDYRNNKLKNLHYLINRRDKLLADHGPDSKIHSSTIEFLNNRIIQEEKYLKRWSPKITDYTQYKSLKEYQQSIGTHAETNLEERGKIFDKNESSNDKNNKKELTIYEKMNQPWNLLNRLRIKPQNTFQV